MGIVTIAGLIVALGFGPLVVIWLAFHRTRPRWVPGWVSRPQRYRLHLVRSEPEIVANRPLEAIVADLRRLGLRFHTLHPHTAYAKVQAVRYAYDRALGECCRALGLPHLLDVLEPGGELDAERERVEDRLCDSGVRLPHAA